MRKISIIFLSILLFVQCAFPVYQVKAATPYTVEMVSNSSNNQYIGSYNSYEEALSAMNSQNSTETSVATIYKDGAPIDSKYAIFKLKPGGVYNLYSSSNSSSVYTSIHGSYGTDAALLGYSNGRVKIMISGFTGWTDINNGIITPISLLGSFGNMINVVGGLGIRIRKSPSLSGEVITKVTNTTNFSYTQTVNADGYTWFKINYNGSDAWIAKTDDVTIISNDTTLNTYYNRYSPTNNLIHHFDYYTGSGYTDQFTNLGTAPSFLTPDIRYYSFDGNYFYSSLTSMLDDYRIGSYANSVNKDEPYYAYYLYLPSHSVTGYTAADLDNIIASKGYNASNSKMYGTGVYFKEAEEVYGQNALMAFGVAMNESNYGTSSIAMNKNNLFGYGAADSCPYDCAYSYASPRDSIMDYASKTGSNYSLATGKYYYGSHYGNKSSGRNVKYATDPYWGEKQAGNSFMNDKNYGSKDFNSSTIGVTKKWVVGAWVFDKPERTNEAYLYTLKNPNNEEPVHDVAVNVVDKVIGLNGVEFYKIYTDLPVSSGHTYGYIPVEEVNVSNHQPVITASDMTIKLGDDIDFMAGVSAFDSENGDLTSKIRYTGNVDPNKPGEYWVTYTVSDNSNFHASKTITFTILDNDTAAIEASDKEIKQFTDFDPMEDVKAVYNDTDITDLVTYEGNVDTKTPGIYEITYKVTDPKGNLVSKKITVTVIKDEAPIIEASDKEIYLNSDFDPMEGVKATDGEDGDLTDKINLDKNDVNTSAVGSYEVVYSVSDKNGQTTIKKITVKVIVNQLPEITAFDKVISVNDPFDIKEGVSASDYEDGDLTDKIVVKENTVDSSKEGKYKVVYEVTDSYGQTVLKTIKVTVEPKIQEFIFKDSMGNDVKVEANKVTLATGFSGASNHLYYLRHSDLYYRNLSKGAEEHIATGVTDLYLEKDEVTAKISADGKVLNENNYINYVIEKEELG